MRVIGDVVDSATARVEEQARRRLPDEDRDGDRYQDAGGHQDEGERVDVHDGQMVGRRTGPGVGPKVPTKLGRRRFLAGVAILASGCAPAAARPPPASPPAALPAMDVDPRTASGLRGSQRCRTVRRPDRFQPALFAHAPVRTVGSPRRS